MAGEVATIIQDTLNNKTELNLTVGVKPFHSLHPPVQKLWADLYPSFYQDVTRRQLIPLLKSAGFIFTSSTKEDRITPLGSSFLLAPTVGVATRHQFKEVQQDEDLVYFTPQIWGLDVLTMKESVTNTNAALQVSSFWLADALNWSPVPVYDPIISRLVKLSEVPDVCMFSLPSRMMDTQFTIPYLPRSSFNRAEVVTVGYPGFVDNEHAERWAVGKTASQLNDHVRFGTGNHLSASPGHLMQGLRVANSVIQDDARALVYNCYTHPGSSGGPVVPLNKPTQFIAVHFGPSVYPNLNCGTPVSNHVFFSMYVSRVLPIFANDMSVLSAPQKQQLVDYLDGSLHIQKHPEEIEASAKAFIVNQLKDMAPSIDVHTPDPHAPVFSLLPPNELTAECEDQLVEKFLVACQPKY